MLMCAHLANIFSSEGNSKARNLVEKTQKI